MIVKPKNMLAVISEMKKQGVTPAPAAESPDQALTMTEAMQFFGYKDFRPGQEEIVKAVLAGENGTLVVCPTGWGKSALFQIPSLMVSGLVIVVSPLIALMKDQVDKLQAAGIKAVLVNSSQTVKEARTALSELVAGDVKILYVAPERFENDEFNRCLHGREIGIFAVDECHCISRWGHDFRPAYSYLGNAIKKLSPKRVLALTATATKPVQEDICTSLGIPNARRFIRGVIRPNLQFAVMYNFGNSRFEAMRHIVEEYKDNGVSTGIIYSPTRAGAEAICAYMKQRGTKATFYHAGMKDKDREETQNLWAEQGGTIVATTAFGMGIDKANVRFVIHAGLSQSIEDWYQECIHPESLVLTPQGQVRADYLCEGDFVVACADGGLFSKKRIVRKILGKSGKWIQIRTKLGSELLVTPNHPVRLRTDERYVEAEHCKIGDGVFNAEYSELYSPMEVNFVDLIDRDKTYVRVSPCIFDAIRVRLSPTQIQQTFKLGRPYDYNMYKKGKRAKLSYWVAICQLAGISLKLLYDNVSEIGTRSGSSLSLPCRLDGDFGWLLGMLMTDGHIKRVKSARMETTIRITLGNTNADIISKFEKIINSYGLGCNRYSRKKKQGRKQFWEVSTSCQPLVDALVSFGMKIGSKSYDIFCGDGLKSAPLDMIGGFIAGCFDGDGNYSKQNNSFRIHSASWKMLSSMTKILRMHGISMKIHTESYRGVGKFRAKADFGYTGAISGSDSISKFLALTSAYSVKEQFCRGGSIRCKRRRKECEGDSIIETRVIDMEFGTVNFAVEDDNNFFVDGVLTHNCGRAGRDGKDSMCASFWDESDYRTQMTLIDMTCPCGKDVSKFWMWLKGTAASEAEEGQKTVTINMTQKDMADRSGVFSASSCISFLKKNGLIEKIGQGKYKVTLKDDVQFDYSSLDVARDDKVQKLNEVVRFYRDKGCRAAYVSDYFGDESFSGPCGCCDNCCP